MATDQPTIRATDPRDGKVHRWVTDCAGTRSRALCPGNFANPATLRNPNADDPLCDLCDVMAHGAALADRMTATDAADYQRGH